MAHHKDLTGTDLHEPKGIASASANEVYVSNGAGSGAWTPLSDRTPPGTIADFMTPLVPSGWLELDGTTFLGATYPDLYDAMVISQTGTRTSGSKIITGLASTSNIGIGYYVAGTGIANASLVQSIDSGTQITVTINAESSGSAAVLISPWALNNSNQMTLPDLTTAGRYRRSRKSGGAGFTIGTYQSDQNKAHTHTGTVDSGGAHTHTGTTDSGGSHTHTGATGSNNIDHSHLVNDATTKTGTFTSAGSNGWGGNTVVATTGANAPHQHAFTTDAGGTHTHTFTTASGGAHTHTFTTASDGGTEVRPVSIVVMTCVRT